MPVRFERVNKSNLSAINNRDHKRKQERRDDVVRVNVSSKIVDRKENVKISGNNSTPRDDKPLDCNERLITIGCKVQSLTKGRFTQQQGIVTKIEKDQMFFVDSESITQQR